jgi:hypothetical protein
MTDAEIKSLTPEQLAKHPAIKKLGEVLSRTKIAHSHEDGCDDDGMDTCPCGHANLYYAAKDAGIKL